jgi:preprotein translocase subunit SecA
MLRKIDSITELSQDEARVVMLALDERLRLEGLEPVFSAEESEEEPEPASMAAPPRVAAPAQGKVGRNDPCPCGSGKKFKKCHGA